MNNRYTQPSHRGISTAAQRRKKPKSTRRKYLREPQPTLDTSWLMDYDVQHMYLGGITYRHSIIWGSAGSGKSNIASMFYSKLQASNKGKSPFKNA